MPIALMATVGLVASGGGKIARADPPPGHQIGEAHAEDDRPWSAGVTAAQKAHAKGLLAVGNELLVQNKYAEALRVYEDAVKVWDHPAIRANMVLCFINLGRTLEAYENAKLALRYGKGPYKGIEVYAKTLNYAKLLDSQVVKLDVRCGESGAFVTLDGQPLLTCPGALRQSLLAGTHQIVARKRGYLTFTSDLVFQPGVTRQLDIRLIRLKDAAITVRRWDIWKPRAIAGSGAGLLLAAGALQLRASTDMERADAGRDRLCGDGCNPNELPERLERLESRAILENRLAVGTAIAGATIAIAGLVGMYLNRARTILPDESGFNAQIVMPVTGSGAGLVLGGSF